MPEYSSIHLKKGKEEAIARRHPWIFSGAVSHITGDVADGDVVEVFAQSGAYVCTGHFQNASIQVRILSFDRIAIDQAFWLARFSSAWQLRQWLQLGNELTNAFRLINAEGDGLPGLIIDIYGNLAVVQCHSIGMHRAIGDIASVLRQIDGIGIQVVYDKSRASLPGEYVKSMQDGYISGEAPAECVIRENGLLFHIEVIEGQKTGFFLDQRDNRALLSKYARGKTVLNTFSYSGGFSAYALSAGALHVVSVDASARAIDVANRNMLLNGFDKDHEGVVGDVTAYLRQSESFDIVVLDPPAFAKSLDKRHNAVQGYKRLNLEGLRKVKPGGMLFTFSCSQVVDRPLFYHTVTAAAIESGREVKVLHHLSQPADHPVNIFHPEGHYLKGLVLQVD